MFKRYLVGLAAIVSSLNAAECWKEPVWSRDQIQVHKNIQYGAAYNNKTKSV